MNDQTVPSQQPEDSAITLVDLQNIISVLDLASSRGAFRGPEMEPVGQLYNKFKFFGNLIVYSKLPLFSFSGYYSPADMFFSTNRFFKIYSQDGRRLEFNCKHDQITFYKSTEYL